MSDNEPRPADLSLQPTGPWRGVSTEPRPADPTLQPTREILGRVVSTYLEEEEEEEEAAEEDEEEDNVRNLPVKAADHTTDVAAAATKSAKTTAEDEGTDVARIVQTLIEKVDTDKMAKVAREVLDLVHEYETKEIERLRQRNLVMIEAKRLDPDLMEGRADSRLRRALRASLVFFGVGCIVLGAWIYSVYGGLVLPTTLLCVGAFCVIMVSTHGTASKLNVEDNLEVFKAARSLVTGDRKKEGEEK